MVNLLRVLEVYRVIALEGVVSLHLIAISRHTWLELDVASITIDTYHLERRRRDCLWIIVLRPNLHAVDKVWRLTIELRKHWTFVDDLEIAVCVSRTFSSQFLNLVY